MRFASASAGDAHANGDCWPDDCFICQSEPDCDDEEDDS